MLMDGTTSVLMLPNPTIWSELLPGVSHCPAATHVCRCLATECSSPQHESCSHTNCFPLCVCSSLPVGMMLSFAWIGLFIATIN